MDVTTVKAITDDPSAWEAREVDVSGWCLRAIELSVFGDTLEDVVSWTPGLGARRGSISGVTLDLQPDESALFESGAIHLDELWSEDLRHRWPGNPKLAKIRIRGKVFYQPVPPGKIIVGRYDPIIVKVWAVEPLFEGIVEWNNYWHSRDASSRSAPVKLT
jgi:hypothetical protein